MNAISEVKLNNMNKLYETGMEVSNKSKAGKKLKKARNKHRKIAKIISIIFIIILLVMLVGNGFLTIYIYDQNFNVRGDSYEPLMFHVEDFQGLSRTQYEFISDKGQKLAGYLYESSDENESDESKGVIVLAHGFGGGGHNSYMDVANYFVQNGYYVFAYDATGCDESEGEGVGGFPQGVIDLDYAINFVEGLDKTKNLPICLFGHSWGAYCVSCIPKYHPEVKAIIECSGFNSSSEEFEAQGKDQAGSYIYTMLPYIHLYEKYKYGEYSKCNALDGLASTDAKVMVVHSQDDGVVPISIGYDKYYEKFKSDDRFTFVEFKDKGHNVFNDNTYADEFDAGFDDWLKTLDYDYNIKENKDRFIEDKADYINKNLDREKWTNTLDKELFGQFLEFYDAAVR